MIRPNARRGETTFRNATEDVRASALEELEEATEQVSALCAALGAHQVFVDIEVRVRGPHSDATFHRDVVYEVYETDDEVAEHGDGEDGR